MYKLQFSYEKNRESNFKCAARTTGIKRDKARSKASAAESCYGRTVEMNLGKILNI